MIRRDAVRQRVRPAGIFGNVSADCARFLAGRVGSEIQAQMIDRAREIEIHDAGLHDRAQVRRVDFQYAVHPRKRHDDAAVAGDRSPRKPRARAASHQRSFIAIREAHNFRYLASRAREDNALGRSQFH